MSEMDRLCLLYRNELEMERKAVSMLPQCRQVLHQMKFLWPQYELDGYHNVWILKPGAKSRGRGVYCVIARPYFTDLVNDHGPGRVMSCIAFRYVCPKVVKTWSKFKVWRLYNA